MRAERIGKIGICLLAAVLSVRAVSRPASAGAPDATAGMRAPGAAGAVVASATRPDPDVRLRELGHSGSMYVLMVSPSEQVQLPVEWTGARPAGTWYRWVPVLGTAGAAVGTTPLVDGQSARAPAEPGVYELEVGWPGGSRRFADARLVVKVPFSHKQGAYLGGYFIGNYPMKSSSNYTPPEGFVEVTRTNRELSLSKHFRLGEFLTKDQAAIWPKFVVVDPRLIDKLELVLAELNAMGVPAHAMVIMSGYRTPQYNQKGLGNGRAELSRHQYGDAADVWVDNDGDWYMDDLNRDGRRDTGDARVMLEAVERVERKYPELVGGAGIYRDNGAHGPFIHIDTRGKRARW